MNNITKNLLYVCCLMVLSPALPAKGYSEAIVLEEQEVETRPQPYEDARQKLKMMDEEEQREFMEKAKKKWAKLSPREKKKYSRKVNGKVREIKRSMEERCEKIRKQSKKSLVLRLYALEMLEKEDE